MEDPNGKVKKQLQLFKNRWREREEEIDINSSMKAPQSLVCFDVFTEKNGVYILFEKRNKYLLEAYIRYYCSAAGGIINHYFISANTKNFNLAKTIRQAEALKRLAELGRTIQNRATDQFLPSILIYLLNQQRWTP